MKRLHFTSRRVLFALALCATFAFAAVWVFEDTLRAGRAAWLRHDATTALAAGDPATALTKARAAWLVHPLEAPSARLLFEILAAERPAEALPWFLQLEQMEAARPEDYRAATMLCLRLNLPATATILLNQFTADEALVALGAGRWEDPQKWLQWILQDPAAHLTLTTEEGLLRPILMRLPIADRPVLLAPLMAAFAHLPVATVLTLGQGLVSDPTTTLAVWTPFWERIRSDARFSGTERLGLLYAAAKSGVLPPAALQAQLGALDLYASESSALLALTHLELGQPKEALKVLDDPLRAPGEPWLSRLRVDARWQLGESAPFFDALDRAGGLSDAQRFAWRGRALLRFTDDVPAAEAVLAESIEAASGDERLELARQLAEWGQLAAARAAAHSLFGHPSAHSGAVQLLARLGVASRNEDDLAAALAEARFEGLANEDPQGLFLLAYLAWLNDTRVSEAAEALSRLMVADGPQLPEFSQLLGALWLRSGSASLAARFVSREAEASSADLRFRLPALWARAQLTPDRFDPAALPPATAIQPLLPREAALLEELASRTGR